MPLGKEYIAQVFEPGGSRLGFGAVAVIRHVAFGVAAGLMIGGGRQGSVDTTSKHRGQSKVEGKELFFHIDRAECEQA